MGIKKRWRHMQVVLKEGVEAAMRADCEVMETCKPKSIAGAFVRGLVLEAAKGKAISIRTVMSLVVWQPDAKESEDAADVAEEHLDWSDDGVWLTMPEAAPKPEEPDPNED